VGEVVRAGGTLTVFRGGAYAEQGSERASVRDDPTAKPHAGGAAP
jgi:hypothetical protein